MCGAGSSAMATTSGGATPARKDRYNPTHAHTHALCPFLALLPFALFLFVLAPSTLLAQETQTERDAARDVLKKMHALEESLDIDGW